MVSDDLTFLNRRRVYEFAAEHRLPTTYELGNYVRDGGLSSLGPDLDEIYDRATDQIDHILKGAKPADLPFEQPARFHVSIRGAAVIGGRHRDENVAPSMRFSWGR